ncbi:glycoside hydrolase family 127 protein [Amphibacillus sp. MSJ-3]|uniref:glycoside hydrolase family 127 protein n=1 Tax=Amphibacillus sp. MSJ-3 TaxID=2841505 RepID=UPI001C0E961C|nr:glycoside hydrolase family 127 protein [Amphibacillus sp. MSJ-3]MBU5595361.1 glycoside hydrolase family 127 protein [Amphibacillus sp. MSJ-3]
MNKVKLNQGLFKASEEKGKEYLLYLDVDRLIAPCYEAVGHKPRAPRYGGWESMEIAGHSVGHWLSAASLMYKVTGDLRLKEKIEYAVDELAIVQGFDPDGYVSGFKRDCFDEVFTGDFRVENFSLGGSWVPWYSIDKIFAGLIDAYQLASSNKARTVLEKLSNWAECGLRQLTDEQFQRMLICEFGAMNETMARVYQITGEERFLTLAERFNHDAILEPLSQGIDDLAGKHANTQIPKVIGVARLYEITKKPSYQKMAQFFWDTVTKHRSYVFGGNSHAEHFGPIDTEPLGILTTETCNTYNMLKLTEHLFHWNPDSQYMDYYENGLYNHILASQDPDSGMKTYFVATEPGHFKVYCSPEHSFWCCTGTGMENPARYTKNIYTRKNNDLYLNLFIPSTLTLEDKELQFVQKTNFPYQQASELIVNEGYGAELTIHIRKPYWLAGEMNILVNGQPVESDLVNGYYQIRQSWFKGDVILFQLPMNLHSYTAKDQPHKKAFLYGPILLAGKLGHEAYPEKDIVSDHQIYNNHPLIDVPTLVTSEVPDIWLHLVNSDTLTFETDPIGQPGQQRMTLIPFYHLHHERYTIYWDVMSEETFSSYIDHEKEKADQLRKKTVDFVQPGEQQPETDHQIQSNQSEMGYLNIVDRHWRDARDGGFISYQLRVDPNKQNSLMVTYYGGDHDIFIDGKVFTRRFNISIDGEEIVTETLTARQAGELFDRTYPIPIGITKGKEQVEIRFQAGQEEIAGGLYGIRIIRD